MKLIKVESLDHLKEVARYKENEDGHKDFRVYVNPMVFTARMICYCPEDEKCWSIINEFDDSEGEYTEKEFMEAHTSLLTHILQGRLYWCDYSQSE